MQRRIRTEGFTLIELLVVIAIIAILASILFPVFISAKRSAGKSSCANQIKQLNTAFGMYRGDWNGWYPLGGFRFANADYTGEWQNVTWRYVKKDSVYRCPHSICPDMDLSNPTSYGDDASKPRTPVTYLYNMALGAEQSSASAYQFHPRSHSEGEVLGASKCILLIEGNPGVVSSQFNGTDCHGRTRTLWLNDFTFYKTASVITGADLARKSFGLPHHGDGGNVTFCDGHTGYYRYATARHP